MPSFATFANLRSFAEDIADKSVFLEKRASRQTFDTFLSHSSKDDEYLPGVIEVIENHGGTVYVDDGDARLPNPPNTDTAKILRDTINKSRRFVLFVTTNSKTSKWIPWELALGDGLLSTYAVALFPTAERQFDQSWAEQEYLGLYQRVVWGKIEGDKDPRWIVYNHHKNSAVGLRKWLTG